MTLFGVFIPIYALNTGQPEFTCSKLTMETLKQCIEPV